MWIRLKHSGKVGLSHSQLELLVLQRTAALQTLSQRLLKVQDEERRRVARHLTRCPRSLHWPTRHYRRFARKASQNPDAEPSDGEQLDLFLWTGLISGSEQSGKKHFTVAFNDIG
jgi:hypothetical protein